MATDFDTPSIDSNICLGMGCSRTLEKLDQSSPWNWAGNIRFGYFPVLWGLVGSPQVEVEEKII